MTRIGWVGTIAVVLLGGLCASPASAQSGHSHLFPPPSEGGFFFRRHKHPVPPLPPEYVQRQNTPTPHHHGYILPEGPGYGWGFPNGNPDGYGYADYGTALPLGGDRTPDYYFPRYFSLMPEQCFLQSYYNPYTQRGQRYISWSGCGGEHPFGGPPVGSAETPIHPDREGQDRPPVVTPPSFTGNVEAPPVSGSQMGSPP